VSRNQQENRSSTYRLAALYSPKPLLTDAKAMGVNPQPVHSILRVTNNHSPRIIVRKASLRHSLAETAKVTQHRPNLLAERVALFGR
jgi:hypothetical protein